MAWLASVPAYFALRIASALLLLKLSAACLGVADFAIFTQFMLFAALVNMLSVAGIQNGLIRQAAAASEAELAKVERSALAIWLGAFVLLGSVILIAAPFLSQILAGTRGHRFAILGIGLVGLLAGPGQIWSSLLSGRKRVAASLGAQAAGLVVSAGSAAFFLFRAEPVAAVLGFSTGGLVAAASAFLLWRPSRPARRGVGGAQIKPLLLYSAAFAATTAFSSTILFALRSLYRDVFGLNALGYWVAANRISDMSTQLIGLFMIQYFVPHFTMAREEGARRALVLRCWIGGSAAMALVLACFSLFPELLIRLFLSSAYLPAIPAIRLYMIGDFLRVTTSLAMFTAFAGGRPGRYAAIEMLAFALFAIVTLALLRLGRSDAPTLGYAWTYAILSAIIVPASLLRRLAPAGGEHAGDRMSHVEQAVEAA